MSGGGGGANGNGTKPHGGGGIQINDFNDLINLCNEYKEIKLKYELENNVNLVNFDNERIEISFNEDLDKEFIKILSSKLYEWTKERWIITLSKKVGKMSRMGKIMRGRMVRAEKKQRRLNYDA